MSESGKKNPEYVRKRRKVSFTAEDLEDGGRTGSDEEWNDQRKKKTQGKKRSGDGGSMEAGTSTAQDGKTARFVSTAKDRSELKAIIKKTDKKKARS